MLSLGVRSGMVERGFSWVWSSAEERARVPAYVTRGGVLEGELPGNRYP